VEFSGGRSYYDAPSGPALLQFPAAQAPGAMNPADEPPFGGLSPPPRKQPEADPSGKKDRSPGHNGSTREHETAVNPRSYREASTAVSIDSIRS
jgi:hypothetical protein